MATDIPDIPQSVDGAVRKPLSKLREAVQVLLGFRGDPLDAALTMRRMLTNGFAKQVSTTPGGPVSYVPVGGTGGTGSGGTPEVDLTPPPNVPDFTASPGLTQIFVEWPAATYTQGNGHKQTNIYAVKKAASDPSLPTFSQATRVFSATGALTVASLPSDLSTRWHIWLKYETNDGVESSAPTGGTNGKVAQTGKIGNTDLGPLIVEAGNIASGAVTPGKLAVQIGGGNLLSNSGFETGLGNPWVQHFAAGVPSYTGQIVTSIKKAGTYGHKMTGTGLTPAGTDSFCYQTVPCRPNTTYTASAWVYVESITGSSASGRSLLVFYPGGPVVQDTSFVPGHPVGVWVRKVVTITTGPTTTAMDIRTYAPVGTVYWDDVQLEEGDVPTAYAPRPDEILPGTITQTEIADGSITTPKLVAGAVVAGTIAAGAVVTDKLAADSVTAAKIAAGAIAVGSAAIANGAILNAMIADATIDNAKIASLSVSKLLAGSLAVGQHITSTNYVAGSSGWYIGAHGFAEFSNVTIRGATYTGTIYAGAGRVANIIIDANGLRNEGFASGSSGFYLRDDGYAEFNSGAVFRGTLDVGGNSGQRTKHTSAGVQVFNASNVDVIALGIF